MRVALLAVLLVAFAGCGADDWPAPHARPFAVGELGPGFVDPAKPSAPDATITPLPGSWDEPTGNVTAATFSAHERAAPALRAGVAAVLTGWRGIVVEV